MSKFVTSADKSPLLFNNFKPLNWGTDKISFRVVIIMSSASDLHNH